MGKIRGIPDCTGPHGRGLGPGKGKGDGTGLKKTKKVKEKKKENKSYARPVRTRFSHDPVRKSRDNYLDLLLDEAYEDPFDFSTIDEAVSYLTNKYQLSFKDINYLKAKLKEKGLFLK